MGEDCVKHIAEGWNTYLSACLNGVLELQFHLLL